MFTSRTKNDLMIEVWEALDCESVGAKEVNAIAEAVRAKFGNSAVDSPMRIARLLADEGAELRHSEIMELAISTNFESPYDAMFRNILKIPDLKQTLNSIRQLDNLRRKLLSENDKEGLRILRETAINGKKEAGAISDDARITQKKRIENQEIVEWITIWLQSPEIFENWVTLRMKSKDFQEKLGEI